MLAMKPALNLSDNALALPAPASSFHKYWNILRISLVERLVYRADFIVSTIFRFLPLVTSFLLWQAVFDGSGEKSSPAISATAT
jgi:ABC-2 type transport system permease protein